MKTLSQDSRYPGQNLNLGPPKCKATVLAIRPGGRAIPQAPGRSGTSGPPLSVPTQYFQLF
jgi:hypothetical protein